MEDGPVSLWDILGFIVTGAVFFTAVAYLEHFAKKALERWRLYRKKN
jgi:hypothetical protein